jgi:hypothetical protein
MKMECFIINFNILQQAAPVQSSMEITMVPSCIQGQQIVGNYCGEHSKQTSFNQLVS